MKNSVLQCKKNSDKITKVRRKKVCYYRQAAKIYVGGLKNGKMRIVR
jgi:hypothetical protein